MLITVDMGTTNTGFRIFDGATGAYGLTRVGGAGTFGGDNTAVRLFVRDGIKSLLSESGTDESSIEAVIAYGMATSSLGIAEVPHIPAYAGINELSQALVKKQYPDIFDGDFYLIPGVVNKDGSDFMRGEETEFVGLSLTENVSGALVILPGSHVKFISSAGARITKCVTYMCGELIRATCSHTLLRASLPEQYPDTFIADELLRGYIVCSDLGLTRALFKVRADDLSGGFTPEELHSFLVGAIIADSVRDAVLGPHERIIIGSTCPLKAAYATLLGTVCGKKIIAVPDSQAELSSCRGAAAILKACQK